MPTVINTNLASLFAQNSLSNAQNNLAQSVQRLSSGLRINSAKDDAAGLTIAQNMQSQINGVNQSIRNLSDATNLIQTAESSLATIQDMLLRMKQLSTQGYNGSLSTTQKNAIVNEVNELNSEINATAARTQFNGINLLSSSARVDSKTGDIFVGQYLTETAVSIDETGVNLDETATYDLSLATPALAAGSSSYRIYTDNDSFKRDMVGTYALTSYDDELTMTYTDADTGKISQQVLKVNAALGDGVSDKTTLQDLNFTNFGIRISLSNTIDSGDSDVLGANIASIFNGKNIVYDGQSSRITAIDLSGTQSANYQLTASASSVSETLESAVVTWRALAATESLTVAGITVTNNLGGDTLTAADLENIFSGLTAGTTVATTIADGDYDYTVTGTLDGYNVTQVVDGTSSRFTSTVSGNVTDLTVTQDSTSPSTRAITEYVSSSSGGSVTLAYTDNNGVDHEEVVDLVDADFTKNSDAYIKFGDAGISIKIHNYQTQTGAQIAAQLAALYGQDGNTLSIGNLNVLESDSSALNFQSGPTTEAFIKINTLNVMTGSSGSFEGASDEMKAVGSLITDGLASLDSSNTDPEWQAVFSSLGAAIDAAIDYISTERAVYGSQVNRLSFMTTNLQANSTNLQNSRSSIIDTDFAAETAALTKGQIMQQAATAMLAQANQMPNVILSLLK
jgi:flagellin